MDNKPDGKTPSLSELAEQIRRDSEAKARLEETFGMTTDGLDEMDELFSDDIKKLKQQARKVDVSEPYFLPFEHGKMLMNWKQEDSTRSEKTYDKWKEKIRSADGRFLFLEGIYQRNVPSKRWRKISDYCRGNSEETKFCVLAYFLDELLMENLLKEIKIDISEDDIPDEQKKIRRLKRTLKKTDYIFITDSSLKKEMENISEKDYSNESVEVFDACRKKTLRLFREQLNFKKQWLEYLSELVSFFRGSAHSRRKRSQKKHFRTIPDYKDHEDFFSMDKEECSLLFSCPTEDCPYGPETLEFQQKHICHIFMELDKAGYLSCE